MKYIPVLRKRLVIEAIYDPATPLSIERITNYLSMLSRVINMTIVYGPLVHHWAHDYKPDYYDGYEGWVMWAESGCQFYSWERFDFITIDLFTCKDFDIQQAVDFTRDFFCCSEIAFREIEPVLGGPSKRNPNNHPGVMIRKVGNRNLGLIATQDIKKDEVVCVFDGEVYYQTSEQGLYAEHPDAAETAAPFHKHWARDGMLDSFSRFINHSCEPNCGIRDLFTVVTMRDISAGEELCIDYGMLCNNDWENPEGACWCGSSQCRGKILPYRLLPQEVKDKYKGYVSDWIVR